MFYLVQKAENLWGLFDENNDQHPAGFQALTFWNPLLTGRDDIEKMPLKPFPFEMPPAPDSALHVSTETLLLNLDHPLHIQEEEPQLDFYMPPEPAQTPVVRSRHMMLNQWKQQKSLPKASAEQVEQDNVFLIHLFELDNHEDILQFAETFDDNISGLTDSKSAIARDVTQKTDDLVTIAKKLERKEALTDNDKRLLDYFQNDIVYNYENRAIIHHVGLQYPQLTFAPGQPYRVVLVAHGGGYNQHDDMLYSSGDDTLTVEDICSSDLIHVLRHADYVKCIGCGNYRFAAELSRQLPDVSVAGYTMDVGTRKWNGRYNVAHNELLKDGKFPPRSSVKKIYQNGREVPQYLNDDLHHFREMSKFKKYP